MDCDLNSVALHYCSPAMSLLLAALAYSVSHTGVVAPGKDGPLHWQVLLAVTVHLCHAAHAVAAGTRLIDEMLAKTSMGSCADFKVARAGACFCGVVQ